tara:strand:+ start:6463 stop:6681 length:219 start_codon:yes stop_codon:yes gene_type:complete
MDFKPLAERLKIKMAEEEAAAAAAAEAKKAAPYERLWGRNTPPPTIENMDASTAWWKPPELKGLISNNMRGY